MTDENLIRIATHPLQTPVWAKFRKKWGNEILETKWGIITVHRLKPFKYKIGIFEKGPTPTKLMLDDLKKIGRDNNLISIKLEANVEKSEHLVNLITKYAVPGRRLFTPTTFQIDLKPSTETLMRGFSSKARYNIRVAEKHGVTIKEDNSESAFNRYLELTAETVKRQGFYAHSKKYHRLMWKYLKGNIAHLLVARYKGEIITTWILFVWKDFLYYPYGASSNEHKEVMANNLMMWEAIKFGKKLGLKTFDLWGREEGKGFTKFKEGYNPKVVEFLGTWDLIINKPIYFIYRIAEWFRWPTLKVAARFGLPKHRF